MTTQPDKTIQIKATIQKTSSEDPVGQPAQEMTIEKPVKAVDAEASSSITTPSSAAVWGFDPSTATTVTLDSFTVSVTPSMWVVYTNLTTGTNYYYMILQTQFAMTPVEVSQTPSNRGYCNYNFQCTNQLSSPSANTALVAWGPSSGSSTIPSMTLGTTTGNVSWSTPLPFTPAPEDWTWSDGSDPSTQTQACTYYLNSPWNSQAYPLSAWDDNKLVNYQYKEDKENNTYQVEPFQSSSTGTLTINTYTAWRVPADSAWIETTGTFEGNFVQFETRNKGTSGGHYEETVKGDWSLWWDIAGISVQNGRKQGT